MQRTATETEIEDLVEEEGARDQTPVLCLVLDHLGKIAVIIVLAFLTIAWFFLRNKS
jgi:hypothetical protein